MCILRAAVHMLLPRAPWQTKCLRCNIRLVWTVLVWSVTHVQGFRLGGRRGLQGPWILREGNAYPESLAAVASVSPSRGYGTRRGSFSQYPKGGLSSALPQLEANPPPLTPTVNHQQSFALG